ncbi:hypothetical protein BaRGS_00006918 [Batillaria attramentaria]|uniref:Uncharacterized protein n=1 Tax=Batillaria attramentaria TaxID=370345 RepID=A0ABD0LR54_9CAEN
MLTEPLESIKESVPIYMLLSGQDDVCSMLRRTQQRDWEWRARDAGPRRQVTMAAGSVHQACGVFMKARYVYCAFNNILLLAPSS